MSSSSLWIKERLEKMGETRYLLLGREAFYSILNNIYAQFLLENAQLKGHFLSSVHKKDISDETPAQVRQYLSGLGIAEWENVYLVWVANQIGVQMAFGDFVQYYDDIWYPSSDDIWISSENLSWFLNFDHEEIITFVSI